MDIQRMKEDDDVIRAALTSLKSTTGISVTMYAQVAADGSARVTHWLGLKTTALHNLMIAPGTGVAGRVIEHRRAVGFTEYTRAKDITHDYDRRVQEEGLHSLIGLPVIVQRDVVGVLYVGVHSPVRLSEKVIEELTMTARSLEQDLAVNRALQRSEGVRPASLKHGRAATGAEWEQVRATHSKLRMLANRITDEGLRQELETLCDQMIAPVRVKPTTKLSARERDVLACVALGQTNVEAAKELQIGAETVKSYLRSVMRKLGAHTRYEAVNAARRIGALP